MKSYFKCFYALLSLVLLFAFPVAKAGGYFGCANLYKIDKKTGEVVENLGFGSIQISGDIHHTYRGFETEGLKISAMKWFSCDDEKAACAAACKDKYDDDSAINKCSVACYDSFDKHCPPGKNNASGEYDSFRFEICRKIADFNTCETLKPAVTPQEMTYILIDGKKQERAFFEEEAGGKYAYYYKQEMPRNMHFKKLKDAGYLDETAEEEYALKSADYALNNIGEAPKYKACLDYDKTVTDEFKKLKD